MNTEEENFEENNGLQFEGDDNDFLNDEFEKESQEKEFNIEELEGLAPDLADLAPKNEEEQEEEEEEEENPFEDKNPKEEEIDVDLIALNKKFGTDFKTEEDLKNHLKKTDEEEKVDEEKLSYEKEKNVVPLYESWLAWDDEKLVKETLFSQAAQENRDITDPEVIEEIDAQIESLKDSNLLKNQAGAIRLNVANALQKSEAIIRKYENAQALSIEEEKKANNEKLQNALVSLTKDGFLGFQVDKKELVEVYKQIKSKEWFDKINSSQEGIARLALIDRYFDKIVEKLGKPTQSDGIAKTMEELGLTGSRAQGLASRVLKDTANNKGATNISNFVK